MDVVHIEYYHGYRIKIIPDQDAQSPREWDNLGTMACWYRHYNLGDEQPKMTPDEYMLNMLREFDARYPYDEDWTGTLEDLKQELEKYYVILTLYLYDHSGISMSRQSFIGRAQHAEWDSGRVGFIYVSKRDVLKEFSKKRWSKSLEEKARKILEGEVETYNQYLTGDVYGFVITKLDLENEYDDDGEEVDSCWGFFGFDSCLQEAKRNADLFRDYAAEAEVKAEAIAPYLF